MTDLFAPLSLGRARLVNRLVVAPMTTSQSEADGTVSEAEMRWLERLAADGYGMVITCAAAISRSSIAFHRQMSLGDDRHVPRLRMLATRMGQHPTLSVVQLCHGGSRALPELTGEPAKSASRYELAVPGFVPPRAMSTDEIARTVSDFAAAAARAADAGFGGIELHGANGYLFTQFTSTMTNLRTDAYGGSLENRARFSRQVVRACRERTPPGFVIGYRMSFEAMGLDTGLDLDDNIQILRWLADDGIDYAHVSHLDLAAKSVKYPQDFALRRIRAGVGPRLPIMAAGGVTSRQDADRALELGADLVAIGRAAIGNAHVPRLLAEGTALKRTPFDREQLASLDVSDDFIHYMSTAIPVSSLHIVSPNPHGQ